MTATKLGLTALAASLLLGGAYAPSASASSSRREPACVFDKHEPVSMAPYTVDTVLDWGSHVFASGAQLFVPAREGLTKEALIVSVKHALASAHVVSTEADDSTKAICEMPRLKGVQVDVVATGNGYWVQLVGRDSKTADALMNWARRLIEARHSRSAPMAASR